jgi:hypothetical protein
MVETDVTTEVTFNIFLLDEFVTEGRFEYTKTVESTAFEPRAWTLGGLRPGCSYALYVGGVCQADTTCLYATFATVPPAAKDLRCLLTHQARADQTMAGEVDLWSELEAIVSDNSAFEHRSARLTSRASAGKPVHFVVHDGGFLSVEGLLRTRGLELLDLMTREGMSSDVWMRMLEKTETDLMDVYRKALTSPAVAKTLRRCGHLFVCGQAEAASITTSFLNMGRPAPVFLTEMEAKAAEATANAERLRAQREAQKAERDAQKVHGSITSAALQIPSHPPPSPPNSRRIGQ